MEKLRYQLIGEANEFTMDSLDGFQPERESTRKAEEEQKVKVMVGIQDNSHGSSHGHGHGHGQGVKSIFTLVFQAAEQQRNTERLKELIRIKTEVNNRRKQFCSMLMFSVRWRRT